MANDRQQRAARAEQMRKERESAERRQRNLITVGIVVAVAVLVGLAAFAISSVSSENADESEIVQPQNFSDEGGIEYPATGEVAEDAPVVSIYEDYMCPHCGTFEATSGTFLKEQAADGAIKLEFHPMVILDGNTDNGPAHDTMNAAVCVADQEGAEAFWTMHTALFSAGYFNGTEPTREALVATGADAGVEVPESCLRTSRFVPWIFDERTKASSDDREVSSTPTVFVNGEKVEDTTQAGLTAAIDDARAS